MWLNSAIGSNIGLIASVSGKQIPGTPGPADPTNFGPNCVGCITTQNLANGAITDTKIAPHSELLSISHITMWKALTDS